jgi:hypothetical protein
MKEKKTTEIGRKYFESAKAAKLRYELSQIDLG